MKYLSRISSEVPGNPFRATIGVEKGSRYHSHFFSLFMLRMMHSSESPRENKILVARVMPLSGQVRYCSRVNFTEKSAQSVRFPRFSCWFFATLEDRHKSFFFCYFLMSLLWFHSGATIPATTYRQICCWLRHNDCS